MNGYELREAFYDLSKSSLKNNFYNMEFSQERFLSIFGINKIEEIEGMTLQEIRVKKEKIINYVFDNADYNMRSDLAKIL